MAGQEVARAPHRESELDKGEGVRPLITHKYRGSQQFSRVEYSTQIY